MLGLLTRSKIMAQLINSDFLMERFAVRDSGFEIAFGKTIGCGCWGTRVSNHESGIYLLAFVLKNHSDELDYRQVTTTSSVLYF